MRDIVTGKRFDRFVSNKTDREGVEAYYKAHNFAPLWVGSAAEEERAKAAATYLAQVDTVGLNPSDYPVPDLKPAATAGEQAEAELRFTASVLTYARRAQIGQINFTRVDGDIAFNLVAPEPAKVLAKLAEDNDVAAALDSYNPPQEGFKALKAKLAELRNGGGVHAKATEEKKKQLVHIAEGKILSNGMKDARVIALRQRLDVAGDKNNPLYDEAVVEAVKTFQTEADIGVDGDLGPNTTRALNGEKQVAHRNSASPADTILVNMERWRWLSRKLGNASDTYVVVNVPDFTVDPVPRRQALLEDQDRGRQADPCDADDLGGDEVHHGQSDLERAALDHRERVSARAGGRTRMRLSASASRSGRIPTAPCMSSSRRAPAMRWAASASTSPTSSWSTSTTRRTNIFSARQARLQPRLHAG